MSSRQKIFIGLVTMLLTVPAFAAEDAVILGVPISKVESWGGGTKKYDLSEKERREYVLSIKKRNGEYYWTSREDKQLIYVLSGAFHYFVTPASGYIKIVNRHALIGKKEGPRFAYMEHMA